MNDMNYDDLTKKLDIEIGFGYWKRYVAGAFWSNISTPINLSITILSVLVSTQNDSDMFGKNSISGLSFGVTILSTINTFCKPHTQVMSNVSLSKKWAEFGHRLEKIYFKYLNVSDMETRLSKRAELESLREDVAKFKNDLGIESQNYLTDLIHLICKYTCLFNQDKWMDLTIDADNDGNT